MPTKSFTKTVTIKGSQINMFLYAVDKSSQNYKQVEVSVKEISKEGIKDFFLSIGGKV